MGNAPSSRGRSGDSGGELGEPGVRRGAVFNGQPLSALAPPFWVSPLAPRRAREAATGANPRPGFPPRAVRVPVSGSRPALRGPLRGSYTGSCEVALATGLQEHAPRVPAATCVCVLRRGADGCREWRTPSRMGEDRECECGGVCACVRVCWCVRAGRGGGGRCALARRRPKKDCKV